MKTKFIAIAALGKNRQIGLDGKLPWNYPDEYAHYESTVKNHYVLIGRKNFELNQGDIAGTIPLVLSRQNYSHPKALAFHSMEEVTEYALKNKIETIFVIGGAEIYQLTLPYISEFLCSVVDYDGPADTYFPEYLNYPWEVLGEEIHPDWTLYHLAKEANPL